MLYFHCGVCSKHIPRDLTSLDKRVEYTNGHVEEVWNIACHGDTTKFTVMDPDNVRNHLTVFLPPPKPGKKTRCECGGEATGYGPGHPGHSRWCPESPG